MNSNSSVSKNNVLISSAGRRVSLLRAFQHELKKHFPEGKVFTSDLNVGLSAACMDSCKEISVLPLSHPDFIESLINECLKRDIGLIIPTIDPELELFAKNISDFRNNGIEVVVSSEALIKAFEDKRETHKFFSLLEVKTAREYSHEDYVLPIFVKPFNGSGGLNTFAIHEEAELIEKLKADNQYMFLDYLDPKEYNEYTCDLYFDKNSRLRCVVPRRRIEVRAGEVQKGRTERNVLEEFIRDRFSYLDGARGCICVQFFVHNVSNEVIGIEVNPRFGGGFPLTYKAGGNFPGWLISEYFLGEEIEDKFDSWESDLLMLRYDHEIWVHGHKD